MFRIGFYNERDQLIGLSRLCWTDKEAALEYKRLGQKFKRIAIIQNEGPLAKRVHVKNGR